MAGRFARARVPEGGRVTYIEASAVTTAVALGIVCILTGVGPLHALGRLLVEARAACFMVGRGVEQGWCAAREYRGEALRRARII